MLLLWWNFKKSVKYNEVVNFDPLSVFSRLISVVERTNTSNEYFKYELTQGPTSLLKDGFMRESQKSDLKNIIIENAHNFETYPASKIVVDEGALVHGIKIVLIVKCILRLLTK